MRELQRLKARHLTLIDLHIAGLPNKSIAEEMEMTESTVSIILRAPIVQQEISRRRGKIETKTDEAYVEMVTRAKAIMTKGLVPAAEKLVSQIDHDDPRVAQSACLNVLETAFGKKNENPQSSVVVNIEQLQVLQQTLRELSPPDHSKIETSAAVA